METRSPMGPPVPKLVQPNFHDRLHGVLGPQHVPSHQPKMVERNTEGRIDVLHPLLTPWHQLFEPIACILMFNMKWKPVSNGRDRKRRAKSPRRSRNADIKELPNTPSGLKFTPGNRMRRERNREGREREKRETNTHTQSQDAH